MTTMEFFLLVIAHCVVLCGTYEFLCVPAHSEGVCARHRRCAVVDEDRRSPGFICWRHWDARSRFENRHLRRVRSIRRCGIAGPRSATESDAAGRRCCGEIVRNERGETAKKFNRLVVGAAHFVACASSEIYEHALAVDNEIERSVPGGCVWGGEVIRSRACANQRETTSQRRTPENAVTVEEKRR